MLLNYLRMSRIPLSGERIVLDKDSRAVIQTDGGKAYMIGFSMFKKTLLIIAATFSIFGCAGDVSQLLQQDVKERVVSTDDFFDPFCRERTDGRPLTCLEVYAPVLFISGGYDDQTKLDYKPTEIRSMLDESNLHGPKDPSESFSKVHDHKKVVIYSLDMNNLFYKIFKPSKFQLNMVDADPGFLFYRAPDSSRFNDKYRTVVYGREAIYETQKGSSPSFVKYRILQYWFFYPYNNWLNHHEGDWEMIQIILEEATKTPLKITYSWHLSGDTFDWDDPCVEKVAETHPVVYVASGSHASYWSEGDHTFSQFGLPCFFTDHARPMKTLIPEGVGIEASDIQGDLRDLPKSFYTLSGNIDQIPWTKWGGHWGETETFFLPGCSGPQSPYYHKVDNKYSKWRNPTAYANNPKSSHYGLCAQSPVRLHVYDPEGNHVGRDEAGDLEINIPGLYVYTPDDRQIIVLTSEDLVFKIEATDEGKFDFGFTRYQNEISTVTNVAYYDVQITDKTIATVCVTEDNPEYIMEVDLDGDGSVDLLKTPNPEDVIVKKILVGDLNENIKQAPFPVEYDGDGDAIFDSVDNCKEKFNPDQRDLDGNRVGDACDDLDRDGVADDVDNCPFIPNDQMDSDADGIGDICDSCPNDPADDEDGDGVCGDVDQCPGTPQGERVDASGCSASEREQYSRARLSGQDIARRFADREQRRTDVVTARRQGDEYRDYYGHGSRGTGAHEQMMARIRQMSEEMSATVEEGRRHPPSTGRTGPAPQPTKPPTQIACDAITKQGGNIPQTFIVELGQKSCTFIFEYDMYNIPDRMIVQYGGKTLYDTGCVGSKQEAGRGKGSKSLTYSGSSTKVTVKVLPSCEGGETKWKFTANCPTK